MLVGVGSDKGTPIPKYDSQNQLIGYWSNESFALQPGIAQISQSNIGTRENKVAFSESDRYLSKLDEKYLLDLSKEIKGHYVKGNNINQIIAAMEKQKPSWRDQTTLPLRYFFIIIALIFFLMRFVTIDKIIAKLKMSKNVRAAN